MKLQRNERETIINYNEQDDTASVYTHNRRLIGRLDALVDARPNACQLVRRLHDGMGAEYVVPKRWIRVNPGGAGRAMTDEQRQAAADRLAQARAARGRDLSGV